MAYNPKSKRTNPKGTPQQVKNLNGLTANKNIDDIRALSKISNGHGTSIDTLNSDVVIINGEISSLQKTKQDNIKLTTTGSSGPATLSGSKLNIPDYSSALSGYVPTSRTLTINGTTYDLSANRTWNVGTVTSIATTGPITGGTITGSGTIGITQATTSTDGYLSSTDWNTFNNKQNAITLTTVGSSGPATLIGSTLNIPNYNAALTGYVPYVGATQNVNLGEFGLTAGQLTLDTSPTGTAVVGTTRWNNTIGSSETTLKGGSVILKNGVDLVARVVNKVTPNTTLTKAGYAAVRVSGAQGQRLAVAYAQANNDNNSADTIGLVAETIATNQEGFIITVGQLEEINTTGSLQGETWVDGDVLYLSPTTPGALTNIKPNGSTGHIVVIGYVEYAHANHGKIYVKIMNGWELDELHNVYINNPLNNQGLFYETSTQLWKNKSIDTALGYTPVPTTRQLTINGTTYDLSANRTWSVGTVTAVTASSPLSSSGGATPNITISQASGTDNGYLSSTDWTTFNNKQPAGNYITALSGEATGSGPGTASVTLNNASVTAKVLTGVNVTGGSINASDSILTAFGKLQNQINGLIGSSIYQGVWNASTNTPALTSGVGTRGYYYIVNVAGSTNLDGITDWNVGDWAIFDGTAWQQVDNTDSVTSVNGQTGAVSLTSDNIPEGVTNLYFTNLRARQALTLTTLGTSGAATYSNTTGILNIPQYQSVLTNPVTGTGTVNYVARWTSSSEISTGVLYDNGTNVGIGTNNPASKLTLQASNNTYALELRNSLGDTRGGFFYDNTSGANTSLFMQSSIGTDVVVLRTSGTSYLNGGNVGIGTTNPIGKLSVDGGDFRFNYDNAATGYYAWFNHNSSQDGGILLSRDNSTLDWQITNGASGNLWFYAYGLGAVALTMQKSNGFVGIGTTAPSKTLDVFGNARFQNAVSRLDFTTGYAGSGDLPAGVLLSTWDTSSNNLAIIPSAQGTVGSKVVMGAYNGSVWRSMVEFANTSGEPNLLLAKSAGNVGIGTSSPSQKLTVEGRAFVDQFQYNQGIQISGVDLNDLSIAGFYAGSGLGNAPDSYGWYYVTVERHSDSSWVHQTATSYGAGNTGNRIYSRTKEAGTWTAWKELSYTSSISGTTNYVSKFTSGNTIGNSLIYDNGSNVGIGTTTPSGALHVATFGQYSYFSSNSGGASIADVQGLAIGFNKSAGGGETIIAYNKGGGSTGGLVFSSNDGGSYAERMRIAANGNVGIGTAAFNLVSAGRTTVSIGGSSSALLEFQAGGYNTAYLYAAAGLFEIYGYDNIISSTNGNERMRITNNGNIGIGTSNPLNKLHIDGSSGIRISDASNSNFRGITFGATGGDSTEYSYIKWQPNSGEFRLYANTAGFGGYMTFYSNNSESMRINSSGNVGIGTTSPSYKLDVAGDIHVQTSSLVGTVYFGNNAQNYLSYYNSDSYYRANGAHYFEGNGFYKGIWDANGFVGIGTTSTLRRLTVAGGHDDTTATLYASGGWGTASLDMWSSEPGLTLEGSGIGNNVNSSPYYGRRTTAYGQSYLRFYLGEMMFSTGATTASEAMRITTNGNIGVGTTSPSSLLSGTEKVLEILNSNVASLYLNSTTGRRWSISSISNGTLTFWDISSVAERMRIDTSGNVGINTSSPSEKLHVSGNVRVTGAYYDSNNQAGTSGQILSSTGSGTDWVDSPTSTATSVAQLLPSATVNYSWTGQVIDGTWVDIFTRANNILTSGVWTVTMYVSDFGQGGNHYQYRYSGTMTWYQGGTNQTGLPAASEIALHRMGHAANNCILYLRTTEEAASDGGNGKLQINANYSNTSNTTITFTFVKII